MTVVPPETVAENMAKNLQKMADVMKELTISPLPKELIILYVQKRTRMSRKDIEAVFEAITELNKQMVIKK
jgi:hypothetical protein